MKKMFKKIVIVSFLLINLTVFSDFPKYIQSSDPTQAPLSNQINCNLYDEEYDD